MIQDSFPDTEFEFVNLGISGNRTEHLVERLDADFIEVQPDIVSILIGVNDVWHHYAFEYVETTDEQFESNYRTLLDAIKSRTNARILMIQPFLLETVDPAKQELCEELARKQAIIQQLADEYADAYLPLDEILHQEMDVEPVEYSRDGVHPTPDGACRIGGMMDRVKELGQTAIALTDHGVLYGAVRFYKACVAEGIKPIIGCEVYVTRRSMADRVHGIDNDPYHLVLLCENRVGYENLCLLVSEAFTSGFYGKPRVDLELLRQHHEGLIALSACLAGRIPSLLAAGDYASAVEYVRVGESLLRLREKSLNYLSDSLSKV